MLQGNFLLHLYRIKTKPVQKTTCKISGTDNKCSVDRTLWIKGVEDGSCGTISSQNDFSKSGENP